MPLFKRPRDINLFNIINEEVIQTIIDTTINVFKINAVDTLENLYGESLNKVYFPGVVVAGLIEHNDPSVNTAEQGPDYEQPIQVRFHRKALQDIELYPEIGDIIEWNNNQYLITTAIEDQLIAGQQDNLYNWSIVCDCVLQRKPVAKVEEIKRAVASKTSIYK